MNILFLHSSRYVDTPWRDGSTRYRCYHAAEALQTLGHLAEVAPLHAADLSHLTHFDVVIVLRPQPSRKLNRLLEQCKRLRIRTVADIDDLIFVPELAGLSPSVINGQAAERIVRQQFQRNLTAMQEFDEISVSTEPLAQAWRATGATTPVTVLPNGLSANWLSHPAKSNPGSAEGRQLITYLPGTRSHDHDFAQINTVLINTLMNHPAADLLIVGELSIKDSRLPAERVMQRPWVAYENLPTVIAASHVTLAPLMQTPFTHAKSHIKFTESAAFGTPSICSPNQDIGRHEVEGLYVASNQQEWEKALDHVLGDSINQCCSSIEAGLCKYDTLKHYARTYCTASVVAEKMVSRWNTHRQPLTISHVAYHAA